MKYPDLTKEEAQAAFAKDPLNWWAWLTLEEWEAVFIGSFAYQNAGVMPEELLSENDLNLQMLWTAADLEVLCGYTFEAITFEKQPIAFKTRSPITPMNMMLAEFLRSGQVPPYDLHFPRAKRWVAEQIPEAVELHDAIEELGAQMRRAEQDLENWKPLDEEEVRAEIRQRIENMKGHLERSLQ